MPQCGYSGTLVNILQSLSVPFETVDVLADERIRQGIKASVVSFVPPRFRKKQQNTGNLLLCLSMRMLAAWRDGMCSVKTFRTP